MNIGIVSPFNPYVAKEYLAGQEKLPQINGNATAVNTLVLSLLEQGHKVAVYTASAQPGRTVVYKGASLKVSVISKVFRPKGMANVRVVGRIKREIERDVRKLDILHGTGRMSMLPRQGDLKSCFRSFVRSGTGALIKSPLHPGCRSVIHGL